MDKKILHSTTAPVTPEPAICSAPTGDHVDELAALLDVVRNARRQAKKPRPNKGAIEKTIQATAASAARTTLDPEKPAVRAPPEPKRPRLLYRSRDAMAALGCGHSKFYELINRGVLDARRFGARTYVTAESLEAFVHLLPRAVTPTIAKAEHERWGGRGKLQRPSQKDRPSVAE
jgi:hypothetical protein